MLMLNYTDDFGCQHCKAVVSTFRDAHGREFAIVHRARGLYDVEPPFAIREVNEDCFYSTNEGEG